MWKIVFCHVLSENGVPPNLNHNFPPWLKKKRWFIDRLVAWQLNGMTQPAWAAQSSKGTASQAFRALFLGSLWKSMEVIDMFDRKQWICPSTPFSWVGEEGIKGIGCRSDSYHLWRRGLGSVGIGPHASSSSCTGRVPTASGMSLSWSSSTIGISHIFKNWDVPVYSKVWCETSKWHPPNGTITFQSHGTSHKGPTVPHMAPNCVWMITISVSQIKETLTFGNRTSQWKIHDNPL